MRLLEMGHSPAIRSQPQADKPIAPTAIIASPPGPMLELAREPARRPQ
jgi:hypothetical protein